MSAVAIIDEAAAVCDQVGDCFRRAGFAVHSAITADAGPAMLLRERFDMVPVDVFLGDASDTLVARIAANMNTPVLLTTGHADAASQLQKVGFPRLLKPFDIDQLSRETMRVMVEPPGDGDSSEGGALPSCPRHAGPGDGRFPTLRPGPDAGSENGGRADRDSREADRSGVRSLRSMQLLVAAEVIIRRQISARIPISVQNSV
jgi:DNA-binding response OmpR family regulator